MTRDPKHDVLFDAVKIGPEEDAQSLLADLALRGSGRGAAGRSGALSRHEGRGRLGRGVHGVLLHPPRVRRVSLHLGAHLGSGRRRATSGYMCEIAHRHGSLAGIQLWYSGGNAPALESREIGRSPSQWLSPLFATRSVYGYEMDDLDIRTVINMYVEAGKRAEAGGLRSARGLCRRRYAPHPVPRAALQPAHRSTTAAASPTARAFSSSCCRR